MDMATAKKRQLRKNTKIVDNLHMVTVEKRHKNTKIVENMDMATAEKKASK